MKPIQLSYLVSVLLFIAVGCENKVNKIPEPNKPTESAEQTQSLKEVPTAGAEAEELGIIIERNVLVPMRDGTILRADVYRPDRGGPYPVLVQRTPYGKDRSFDRFVKDGYIVVSQDARGRYDSGGEFESMWRLKTHDAEDGYDTIEWAADLSGSNGKVGTFGTSYPAFLQWRLAPLAPPSLVAMSACSIPAHIWYGENPCTIRPGFRLMWFIQMAVDMRRRADNPGIHTKWELARLWWEESRKWIYWLPWLELPKDFFGHETSVLMSWLKDPHVDTWKLNEGCKDVVVPNLDIVGWYDHANGDMLMFRTIVKEAKTRAAREGSRIIIGPWTHGVFASKYGNIDFGPNAGLDMVAVQIRWFDHWLKGKQNGIETDPPVRIFVMGDNEWRDEPHWPLQRAKKKILFIDSDGNANTPGGNGRLVTERPGSAKTDVYDYDPTDPVPTPYGEQRPRPADQRLLAERNDILVYQTAPLTERVEVTGNPCVEFYASSSAPDTDWFVRLIDVAPDGLARDVSSGMVRARYRDGFDRPSLVRPGEVVRYTIRMNPTSNAFLPGHRIRLDVTSSDFPNFDRNHNTATDQNADATLVTAKQAIYHGGERATRIILPWIPNPMVEGPTEGAKPESEPQKQVYPLHRAAANGNTEQIKLLLSQGEDVNGIDAEGQTPLHYAAKSCEIEVAQMLVEAGANVHVADKDRVSSLHTAARFGNKDVVEILIANGADIRTRDKWLWSPLYYAAWQGRRDVAELLIAKGAEVNAKDDSEFSPLHYAAQQGHKDVVELLIAKGADISVKNNNGVTPLGYAFSMNRKDVVEYLCAKITDLTSKDNRGLTALHAAAVQGYEEIAELLLSKGAKVDERDVNYEFTALHYAARFGNKDVTDVLIANGADIKAKDKWDYQPIHWAAYHDRPEIVELLIAKGADVNAKTSLGQTPLELAKPRRNTKTIKLLQKSGSKE